MPLLGKVPRGAVVVRALAFGDPPGSLWAAGLDAGAPALIAGGGTEPVTATVAWDADGPDWTLHGDGVSLTVSPIAAPEPTADDSGREPDDAPGRTPWSGRQERCRVVGTVADAAVDAMGVRTELDQVRPAELGSVRGVSGWLSEHEAVTLLALRPVSESGHEHDLVAATVFDPDGWARSLDPRLSTTYDEQGEPTRATLELWIADGERELPRRAAAEAAGPVVRLDSDGATLQVRPLRCYSRGNEGAGVYLLASHR